METRQPYEAVVIGAGIGGLSLGILLAGLGVRTLICEKNAQAGGLMRGYRRAGVDLPVGIHYFGAFGEGEPLRRICELLGVAKRMEVERMGQGGPIDRYCFDHLQFDLPTGLAAFARELNSRFPGDGQAIATVRENLEQVTALQNRFAFFAPLPALLPPALFAPLGDYLDGLGVSPGLRGVLGVAARWLGMSDAECPVFYHHLALASYLSSSWRLKGSGVELAEGLVERFQELGGTLRCGDPVRAILTDAGPVSGVRLASGQEIRTGRVVAAIHPKRALALLPEGSVKTRHQRRVEQLAETEGLFAVNALVDAAQHPALPYNLFRIYTAPNGAVIDGVFYQLRPGPAGRTLLVAMTRSPYGEWGQWEGSVSGRRGPAYEEEKALRARLLLNEAEKLFGSLAGAEIIDCYTPLTLRDWMDAPEGAPYGIVRSLPQLPMAGAIARIVPPGLWFAGQNALSPGVLGTLLGSLQALRQIIGPERFHQEVYPRLTGS